MGLSRADFQSLAEMRVADAHVLLDAQRWDGAFYLAGYAVELGLKSCIVARLLRTDEFPDKNFSSRCYQHKPMLLLREAGLEGMLDAAMALDPDLETNWGIVNTWEETVRYEFISSTDPQKKAEDFYGAVTDPQHGVLSWIKNYW